MYRRHQWREWKELQAERESFLPHLIQPHNLRAAMIISAHRLLFHGGLETILRADTQRGHNAHTTIAEILGQTLCAGS